MLQDIKWDQILETLNTEEKLESFRNRLNKCITECIPRGNKYRTTKVKPGWLNQKVKCHMKDKKMAFKKYKAEVVNVSSQTIQGMQCKNAFRAATKEYERHIAEESKNNPKKFF